MNDAQEKRNEEARDKLIRQIDRKEKIKLGARRKGMRSIWSGFGMFGLIGWSIVIPTLLGTLLGVWVDKHYPSRFSWTLMLLAIGLAVGCLNAWHWVSREDRQMHEKDADDE